MYRNVFEINKDGKSIKLFLFIYSGLKQAKIISNSVNSQISQWGYTLEFHGIRTMNKKEKKKIMDHGGEEKAIQLQIEGSKNITKEKWEKKINDLRGVI